MRICRMKMISAAFAALLLCGFLVACSPTGQSNAAFDNSSTIAETQSVDSGARESKNYTVYVGTNAQNTHVPVMSINDAESALGKIALDYSEGYTLYPAKGGWKDTETGDIYTEDTIVVILSGITDEQAKSFANAAAKALNQKSVLIEADNVTAEYYGQQ